MEYDCGFTKRNKWFRYRAAAIIINNSYSFLLMSKRKLLLFNCLWSLFAQSSEEAVKREVLEETGVEYEVERLAFIHENFFDGDGTLEGIGDQRQP